MECQGGQLDAVARTIIVENPVVRGVAAEDLDALRLQVDQNILLQALELAIGGKLGATIESCTG